MISKAMDFQAGMSIGHIYQPTITYNLAGEVTIAARHTRPSRVAAARKCREQDSRQLISRFERLEHVDVPFLP